MTRIARSALRILSLNRVLNPKNKKQRLKEEDRKNILRQIKDQRLKIKEKTWGRLVAACSWSCR